MKNVLTLTKFSFLSLLRFYFLVSKSNAKKKRKVLPTLILYLLSFGFITFLALRVTRTLATPLIAARQGSYFVGLVLIVNIFICFLQSLMSCPGIMYFTKDNNNLLPLPIKAEELLMSKYLTLLFFEYMSIFFFGVLPLARYGLLAGSGLDFYLRAILVLIILPIFPLMLAICLIVILLSFMKLTKYKGLFQVISTLVIVAISLAINLLVQGNISKDSTVVALANGGLVDLLRPYFPTLSFALDSLVATNILTIVTSLTLLLVSSLVIVYVGVLVGKKLYFKGLIGALYGSSLVISGKVKAKSFTSKGLLFSFFKKEIFSLIRTPIYVSQILLPIILTPLIYVGFGLYSFFSAGSKFELQGVLSGVVDHEILRYVFLGALAFVVFESIYAYGGITTFSRDGEGTIVLKQFPLTFWQIIKYKSIVNATLMLFILPLIIIAGIYTGFYLPLLVLFVLLSIIYAFANSVNLAILDALKPRLHWTSETEVLKSNLRIFFSPIYAFAHLGFLGLLAFKVKNLYLCLSLITILELLLLFIGYYVSTHYEKQISKHLI